MGDAGSTLIGFTVIWLIILATQGTTSILHPVTALWIIAVPLMDMIRVMISRVDEVTVLSSPIVSIYTTYY